MFEKASRLKLRFETGKGLLTVEDLWDLPLTGAGVNLDRVAVELHKQVKEETTVSFVVKPPRTSAELELKFEIVKHVIEVRLAEKAEAQAKVEAREKRDRILTIIDKKQNEKLEGASLEELQKMVAEL